MEEDKQVKRAAGVNDGGRPGSLLYNNRSGSGS